MLKKILLLAAFAVTPLVLSESASAQCYGGGYGYGHHGVYRVPVYGPRVPHHHHGHIYRSGYRHGAIHASPYRYGSRYGHGFGYGYPYYGRGTAISVGRGGFGLRIGF